MRCVNGRSRRAIDLNVYGRQWIVARSTCRKAGPRGLQLALLVPEDELLVDAYRMRWQGALITLATLLLCLPLGWLTSRILVKPLRALVQEADAIRSFDFNFPAARRSPVLEVDQLGVSMATHEGHAGQFLPDHRQPQRRNPLRPVAGTGVV